MSGSPAFAADGGVETLVPPLPDAAALATAIVEVAAATEPLLAAPVEPPHMLPAVTVQTAAGQPATTGAAAAPPPAPEPQTAPTAPSAEVEAPAPQPEPPPVQEEPTNVNVSVRVESPGDDGAVTQTNVAVADESEQYQPQPDQYQQAVPPANDETAREAAPAVTDDNAWEWSWQWDCGNAAPPDVIAPSALDARSWIWKWDWNCGGGGVAGRNRETESSRQYQPPRTQYRPINVNVSIRINSPGNNGPVAQTNVALAVRPPPRAAPPPAAPAPAAAAVVAPVLRIFGEVATHVGGVFADVLPPAAVSTTVALSPTEVCCPLPELRALAAEPAPPASVLLGRPDVRPAQVVEAVPADPVVVARLHERARRSETAAATRPPRPQVRPARPAPSRRPPHDLADAAIVAQGTLGFASLGAPDRNLPYAVLAFVAFAFAFTNVSWAAVRSRPTRGADPDDPPDRPG